MKKKFLLGLLLIMVLVVFSGCTSSNSEGTSFGGGILNWFMQDFTHTFWDSLSSFTGGLPIAIRWLAAIIAYILGAALYLVILIIVLAIALVIALVEGVLGFIWSLILGLFT